MSITAGTQTTVNQTTAGRQINPVVTALSAGGWVVSWLDFGTTHEIYQRRYGADGTPVDEAIVTAGLTITPQQKIAATTGGWVVVWSKEDGSDGFEVQQQAYDASGGLIEDEEGVNTHESGTQHYTAVAKVGSGWVVAWNSADGNALISGQRYNEQGVKVGTETGVSTGSVPTFGPPPEVVGLTGGGWVVAWESSTSLNSGDVLYQVFEDDGDKLGANLTASTTSIGQQKNVQMASLHGGGFIVSWVSVGQDATDGDGVYFQRFSSSGAKVGDETLANTTTAGNQNEQSVTVLSNDGWVVSWRSGGKIYQQAYEADGDRLGSEHEVVGQYNTMTEPSVAALGGGRWVVAAVGGGKIWMQVYNADGTSHGTMWSVSATNDTRSMSQPQVTALGDDAWVVTWQARASITGGGFDEDILQLTFSISEDGPGNQAPDGLTAGTLTVAEGAANATLVGTFTGSDPDAGDTLTFSLANNAGGRFSINSATGELKVAAGAKLDFEQAQSHTVRVVVSDGSLTFHDDFTVTLIDVGSENLSGTGDGETLVGGGGDDQFRGLGGADTLKGGGGGDTLNGGTGKDKLFGGSGKDGFVFDATLKAANADRIADFAHNQDKLRLDEDVFKALGAGKLAASAFYSAMNANAGKDAADRIVYDTRSGKLYYDADGRGGKAAVQFALIDGSPDDLSARDFLVVA